MFIVDDTFELLVHDGCSFQCELRSEIELWSNKCVSHVVFNGVTNYHRSSQWIYRLMNDWMVKNIHFLLHFQYQQKWYTFAWKLCWLLHIILVQQAAFDATLDILVSSSMTFVVVFKYRTDLQWRSCNDNAGFSYLVNWISSIRTRVIVDEVSCQESLRIICTSQKWKFQSFNCWTRDNSE